MSGLSKDDIIRMAEEAGMERCKCEPRCHLHTGGMGSLTYFAKLVAAAEREACAKVCENIYEGDEGCGDWPTPEMCAEAIRARGQG
jgi:hypothetical protein